MKGEIVFGTAQGRTTFLANHDSWRGTHILLIDIVRSLNSEGGIPTGNLVRLDVAATPQSETESYFNALRALPTPPFNRVFLSLHRCGFDGNHAPEPVQYYSYLKGG